jgi:hypothetical protein
MIKLQAAKESEKTGSEAAFRVIAKLFLVPVHHFTKIVINHLVPMIILKQSESSDDDEEQEPLSPQCSSPTPGENHRSYCCVFQNKIEIQFLQREIARV